MSYLRTSLCSSSVSSKRAHKTNSVRQRSSLYSWTLRRRRRRIALLPHGSILLSSKHIPPLILWRAAAPDWAEKVDLRCLKGGKPVERVELRREVGKRPADSITRKLEPTEAVYLHDDLAQMHTVYKRTYEQLASG